MVPPRRAGVNRQKRMLVEREFDIAEVSLASYILSKQAGAPFSAVPVFPRRLFSQNHIFVNANAGIEKTSDLVGKRIAIWAFQVTMSVLAKGDLQGEYGVPWREVEWHTERPEEISWSDDRVTLHRIPEGRTGADLLISGDVDAYINPHPPEKFSPIRLFDGSSRIPNQNADGISASTITTRSCMSWRFVKIWVKPSLACLKR